MRTSFNFVVAGGGCVSSDSNLFICKLLLRLNLEPLPTLFLGLAPSSELMRDVGDPSSTLEFPPAFSACFFVREENDFDGEDDGGDEADSLLFLSAD